MYCVATSDVLIMVWITSNYPAAGSLAVELKTNRVGNDA